MKLFCIVSILLLVKLVQCRLELGKCYLECDDTDEEEKAAFKTSGLPETCSDIQSNTDIQSTSGVFTIYPFENFNGLRVYCDLETDGGRWLVIQKRVDGSEDFDRKFQDYVDGFGRLEGEFWLGLEAIHALTKQGRYELRFDMEDFDNETRYAVYSGFSVGPGSDYALTLGDYNGTAGDSLTSQGQGARFTAKDRDQDNSRENCAEIYKGGFWFNKCHQTNPNGLYLGGPHESYADGIEWYHWHGYYYSLKRMEMKIRRVY